ncbi:MAG: GTPase ObgE [Candidatus Colwellbacteria bacterium]|nr:GTPase ObgE [Candidatus Colwellbacteria bacterium]
MLIDEIKIKISGGAGGRGAVAFQRNLKSLGPTGGHGGRGGRVYFEGVSDLSALNQFRFKKDIKAEDGKDGRSQFRDGSDGRDLTLKIPVGTIIHNVTKGASFEMLKIGQRLLAAKGGRGGRGNFHFRSSRNTSPKEFEEGRVGEEFELRLELKFIADVGLVGFPNVGKSSLLNELTSARSKVANYAFTTLEPNLGVYYELILADLPGLIEGASRGKGLGVKFLKHIERTKVIFHLVSADSADPVKDYKTVRKELGQYSKELLKKREFLMLAKSDLIDAKSQKTLLAKLKKLNKSAIHISVYDWDSLEEVKRILNELVKEKHNSE